MNPKIFLTASSVLLFAAAILAASDGKGFLAMGFTLIAVALAGRAARK